MPRFLKNGGEVVSNPYVRHFAAGGTPMTQEEYQTYLRANPGFPEEQVRQDLIYQGKVPPPLPSAAPASSAAPAPALTVEQLYRQYAGREADPEGLEYWTKDFGSDIDAREVDVFKAAVAAARAQGTEPAAPTVAPALTIEQLYRQYAGREADPEGLEYWTKDFGSDIDAREVDVFKTAVAAARAQGTEPAAPTVIPIALPKGPTAFGQNTTPSTPGIGSTPTRPVMPPTFRPPTKPLLPTALAPTIGPNAFENEVLMRGPARTMERDTSDIPITLAKGPTSGPKLLKEGGEVASNSQLITDYIQQKNKEEQSDVIDTNPLGTAQELLSSVTKINSKAAPIRQSVKRVSRGAGSDASRSKEMNLKVAPLSKSKQMVLDTSSTPEEDKPKGSAREQMDDLVRAYELQIKAVKNKARGLSADTFGAPTLTLEQSGLAKNTLAKRRFNKGGEAKAGSAKEELGALKKLGVFLRDMDVSPTDLMAVLGKTSMAMGTALTPVSLNEGEDKELRRRQSQSATIDNPPKRFNKGGEAKKSDAVEMGASLTPQQIERLAEQEAAEREAASRPAFVSPNMPRATKISQANDPTDRIMGVLEPAVTLGTGAVAAAVGMPRGIYKGLTSGQVGEGKAASIASKEAADFIERNTYVPRSESGKENLAALSKIADDMKLAPAPGGAAMASLARPTAMAAQGANIADDFLQYNRQISVPGASYAVPPQGRVKTPAPASGLGFYSAAEQAALNLPRKEGSGAAFLNDLMKAPDVKKEELSAMGLDEFLKSKPKATREEVQDFIANNRLDVKEVQLGGKVVEDPAGLAKRKEIFDKYEPAILELYRQMDAAPGEYSRDREQGLLDQALEIQFRRDQEADAAYTIPEPLPTRFNRPNLVLPGGENYREILLTLPKQSPTTGDIANKLFGKEMRFLSEAEKDAVVAEARRIESTTPKDFASSHFDEPNILAHMRVNDRVDADGKKMLLIEELQSDWHQAGREQGYKSSKTDSRSAAIAKPMNGYFEVSDQNGNFIANVMNHDLANPTQEAAVAEAQRRIQAPQVGRQADDPRVPDAPFKDTWHQLALKRALKYAADNGYERVGLTTGKQQSQRYNMSTQVDNISYEPTAKGFYINVISKDGPNVLHGDYSVKELEGIVGKELTQKMLAKEGKNEFDPKIEPDLVNIRRLDGVDLELEDKGMKKYYDEIYPTFLAKQAKKYGAQVGETTIPTGRVRDAQGIPAMYPTNEPIRYIDITPGMQDAVPYAKGGMVDKNTAFIKAHS
jgi:3D (Asp-Asp-Asp) domain-containing protein